MWLRRFEEIIVFGKYYPKPHNLVVINLRFALEEYKEIVNNEAYNIQTLCSQVGGYIGMYLCERDLRIQKVFRLQGKPKKSRSQVENKIIMRRAKKIVVLI